MAPSSTLSNPVAKRPSPTFLSLPDPPAGHQRVVVVGAGFGGLRLARKLAGTSGFQVVLVDRHNYHTFQPLLYQVATAGLESGSIVYPIRRTFRGAENVHVRLATVQRVRPEEKVLDTDEGALPYDVLVIATGSKPKFFGDFAEKAEQLLTLKTLPNALDLRSWINQQFERALEHENADWRKRNLSIAIVGGGPTGVELAGALAEMRTHVLPKDYPDVDFSRMAIVLFEAAPRLLGGMSDSAADKAVAFLRKLGVDVRLDTPVQRYEDGILYAGKDGEHQVETESIIWTAGVEGAPVEGLDGLSKGRRIAVDRFNRVPELDGVYAIGDVAEMQTDDFPKGHPMLAPVAQQQADLLAKNLERLQKSQEPKPFTYKDKGSMATIGRHKAVVDLPQFSFHGALAWFVWMFVHIFSLVGFKNRIVALLDWSFNYFTYDRSLSLIVRPYRRRTPPKEETVEEPVAAES